MSLELALKENTEALKANIESNKVLAELLQRLQLPAPAAAAVETASIKAELEANNTKARAAKAAVKAEEAKPECEETEVKEVSYDDLRAVVLKVAQANRSKAEEILAELGVKSLGGLHKNLWPKALALFNKAAAK